MQLDQDRTARLGARCMARGRRITDVGASGKVAVLVLKNTVEHQELFAPIMGMRWESAAGCIAYDRGGAGDLLADTVEHPPLDPRNGRRHPGDRCGMNDG